MRSEKCIGKAINTLVHKYGYTRDQFFIASKSGYIPEDAINGVPGRILMKELIEAGKVLNKIICKTLDY